MQDESNQSKNNLSQLVLQFVGGSTENRNEFCILEQELKEYLFGAVQLNRELLQGS